jgi:hypothetical protein
MDSIADIMMGKYKVEKQKGGINSPFNDAVERVRTTITDQKWSFGRWCGYLKNIPPQTIHEMLGSAKGAKNVGKHFNWLVGEYRKEERKKL